MKTTCKGTPQREGSASGGATFDKLADYSPIKCRVDAPFTQKNSCNIHSKKVTTTTVFFPKQVGVG